MSNISDMGYIREQLGAISEGLKGVRSDVKELKLDFSTRVKSVETDIQKLKEGNAKRVGMALGAGAVGAFFLKVAGALFSAFK